MKKLILAGVLAAVALVSLPAASFAYGGGSPVVTGTVGPEKTVSVDFPAGYYMENEIVAVEVTCTAGNATINNDEAAPGIFRALTEGTYQATGTGAFSLNLTLPAGDFGTCSCQFLGLNSDTEGSADVTYVASEPVAYTGFDAGLYAWTAAGVLALGAALISVMVTRRKAQAKASV